MTGEIHRFEQMDLDSLTRWVEDQAGKAEFCAPTGFDQPAFHRALAPNARQARQLSVVGASRRKRAVSGQACVRGHVRIRLPKPRDPAAIECPQRKADSAAKLGPNARRGRYYLNSENAGTFPIKGQSRRPKIYRCSKCNLITNQDPNYYSWTLRDCQSQYLLAQRLWSLRRPSQRWHPCQLSEVSPSCPALSPRQCRQRRNLQPQPDH